MDPRMTPQGTLSLLPQELLRPGQAPTDTATSQPTDAARTLLNPTAGPIASPTGSPVTSPFGGASLGQILAARNQNFPTASQQPQEPSHADKIGNSISATLTANPQIAQQPG